MHLRKCHNMDQWLNCCGRAVVFQNFGVGGGESVKIFSDSEASQSNFSFDLLLLWGPRFLLSPVHNCFPSLCLCLCLRICDPAAAAVWSPSAFWRTSNHKHCIEFLSRWAPFSIQECVLYCTCDNIEMDCPPSASSSVRPKSEKRWDENASSTCDHLRSFGEAPSV